MNEFILRPTYAEKVYAGVLGKIIGVFLGRPIEGWTHERILEEIGEVDRYLHEELNCQLVVSDDDITGTFTFLRALQDHGFDPGLTPTQIGETWLNYIIEGRTILWWGGMGTSTEHTAFLRLKHGIQAPASGSIEMNGRTVAEQIGAQIFIEGWALINPGDPATAVDFARRAASVSHDGEAIYGAQVIAALTSAAFVQTDMNRLLDIAVNFIPPQSIIAKMIDEIRIWHASGIDWKAAFHRLANKYGYDKYGGGCHIVPNHGIVILALLYGDEDFSRSLMIANTCGWDTDCNSANVGSILGVMGGIAGIEAGYDWRGPVQDRMFLPTADGGRCVSDAVLETHAIVRTAFALHGQNYEPRKARFSFDFPGAVQGFHGDNLLLSNKSHRLKLTLTSTAGTATTPTFPSAEDRTTGGYGLVSSPTLSPGQVVRAQVSGASRPISVGICVASLGASADESEGCASEFQHLLPFETVVLEFEVPDLDGYPATEVGVVVLGNPGDSFYLDWLTWDGTPNVTLGRTSTGNSGRDAWVDAVSEFSQGSKSFRLIQNEGTGMLIHGCRDWTDLTAESVIRVRLVEDAGIAVRVQGLRRYYALRVTRGCQAQLIKCRGTVKILAETPFSWNFDDEILFKLSVEGAFLRGSLNDTTVLEFQDEQDPLDEGAIAFILTEGRIESDSIRISPIQE